MPINYDDECFFIAPIGKDGTETRRRSDGVRDFIVKPAVAEFGLEVKRADDLEKPGQITLQVIHHVLRAKGAVADLTGANPNVFYELAIRHTAKLPVVLIAEVDEIDKLPFDIAQMRVIPFDHRDLASAAEAKDKIAAQMREAFDGEVDSPIATVLTRESLERGSAAEQMLAHLISRVEDLADHNAELVKEIREQPEALPTLNVRWLEEEAKKATPKWFQQRPHEPWKGRRTIEDTVAKELADSNLTYELYEAKSGDVNILLRLGNSGSVIGVEDFSDLRELRDAIQSGRERLEHLDRTMSDRSDSEPPNRPDESSGVG